MTRTGRCQCEIRLDVLDALVDDQRRLQCEEIMQRLDRLGFDPAKYPPPRCCLRCEQRCSRHSGTDVDVEAVIVAAKESLSTVCTASTAPRGASMTAYCEGHLAGAYAPPANVDYVSMDRPRTRN
jgi:hypothetical protein